MGTRDRAAPNRILRESEEVLNELGHPRFTTVVPGNGKQLSRESRGALRGLSDLHQTVRDRDFGVVPPLPSRFW